MAQHGWMKPARSLLKTFGMENPFLYGSLRLGKTLHQLEYEKLETEILSTKIKENQTVAIAQGKIKTVAGETSHKEIFILELVDGRRLIDELRITDEDVSMPDVEI